NFDNLVAERYRLHVSEHRKKAWQAKTEGERRQFAERNPQSMKEGKTQRMSRMFWDKMNPEKIEENKKKKRAEIMSAPPEVLQHRRQRAREWFKQLPEGEQERRKLEISRQMAERWENLSEYERDLMCEKFRLDNNSRFKHEIDEARVSEAL